jgi:isoquinoline 1-oxidoreductase alpha subunit
VEINGRKVEVPAAWQDVSLLSFLRDHLGLTGTKFGCGGGFCGACTVHLNDEAVRACLVPVAVVGDRAVTTIEGLAGDEPLHPVQQAWKEGSVPQCGYCQPGQMMTAAAFLEGNPSPTEEEVASAMSGNLCRCGTYLRIRRAVLRAAALREAGS